MPLGQQRGASQVRPVSTANPPTEGSPLPRIRITRPHHQEILSSKPPYPSHGETYPDHRFSVPTLGPQKSPRQSAPDVIARPATSPRTGTPSSRRVLHTSTPTGSAQPSLGQPGGGGALRAPLLSRLTQIHQHVVILGILVSKFAHDHVQGESRVPSLAVIHRIPSGRMTWGDLFGSCLGWGDGMGLSGTRLTSVSFPFHYTEEAEPTRDFLPVDGHVMICVLRIREQKAPEELRGVVLLCNHPQVTTSREFPTG